jgi:hypothetical protein
MTLHMYCRRMHVYVFIFIMLLHIKFSDIDNIKIERKLRKNSFLFAFMLSLSSKVDETQKLEFEIIDGLTLVKINENCDA